MSAKHTSGSAAQLGSLISTMIAPKKKRVRVSPSAQRRAIAEAQVAALREAIVSIREKIRMTPAWHHGYESAITTIELHVTAIAKATGSAQ